MTIATAPISEGPSTIPAHLVPGLRAAIADYLIAWVDGAVNAIVRKLRKDVDDDIDDALTDYYDGNIAQLLQSPSVIDPFAQAFLLGAGRAQAQTNFVWDLANPYAVQYAHDRAAEMVGMRVLPNGRLIRNPNAQWNVSTTTRKDLANLVQQTLETPGISYQDLKAAIEQHPAFSGLFGEYRAEMIARTELAMAQNQGTTESYDKAGFAHVEVLDNAACPICGTVAGTTQTIEWARANPIGHPNCIRAFNPVIASTLKYKGA